MSNRSGSRSVARNSVGRGPSRVARIESGGGSASAGPRENLAARFPRAPKLRFERVSPSTLGRLLAEPGVRIIDLRRQLPPLPSPYAIGHVPGASWLDVDCVLPDPSRKPRSLLEFAATMARHGIGDDDVVVLYDEVKYGSAAALAQAMVELGHSTVGVLIGGWDAWLAAAYPVDPVPREYPPSTYTARHGARE